MTVFENLRVPSLGRATGWLNSEPLTAALSLLPAGADKKTVFAVALGVRVSTDYLWPHLSRVLPNKPERRSPR